MTIRLFFNIRDINTSLSDNEPQADPSCSPRKVSGLGGERRAQGCDTRRPTVCQAHF